MHRNKGRALVVSIHDVHPLTRPVVGRILEDLRGVGLRKCSLLVVPDYHERAPMKSDPDFCDWLREQADAGHEIVLHGFTHRRRRRRKDGLLKKLITRIYTDGEGEFYDIGEESALEKLTAGLGVLRGCGLSPKGFIAPAWLLSREGESAVRSAGFDYTTRLRTVKHLSSRKTHVSQSLVYSVRSPWRTAMSLRWNVRLFDSLTGNPLLRLGIHPPDYSEPKVWAQIIDLTGDALQERVGMTYQDWVRDFFA